MTPSQLRASRREFNWTMEQMAEALGVPADTLMHWSNGKHRIHPSAEQLIAYWNRFPMTRPLYSPKAKLRNC